MTERMFRFVVLGGPMPIPTNFGPPRSLPGHCILPLEIATIGGRGSDRDARGSR